MLKKILLCLVLCSLTLISNHSISAQDTLNGKCGEDVFWEYADGVLRIYGNGEMTSAPWRKYKECRVGLRKVTIGEGVTSICKLAFSATEEAVTDPNFLSEGVELPESLQHIGIMAFAVTYGITEIKIPANVSEIGDNAFGACRYLERVTFPRESRLKKISDYLFSECDRLKTVVLPEQITYIGDEVFSRCTSLEEIDIPEKVSAMGVRVFEECRALKTIRLPEKMTTIPSGIFMKCWSLTEVEMSDHVKEIGGLAFSFCNELEMITIPSELEKIGKQAFIYCASLNKLKFPDTVTKIGEDAFEGCAGLTSIRLPAELKKIPNKMLYDCTGLKQINIPDTVTKIGENAFGGCANLKKLVIPKNVKKISPCHQDCPQLKEIHNKSKVPYSLSASELVMDWYQGKKKVTEVKSGKKVTSKGKRFKISYSSELLKKYKIRVREKLPQSYVYGKEPKMPKQVASNVANMLFMGWYYETTEKRYETGPARTWYNARVTQFSKGLKGDIRVSPMIDKIKIKKNSAEKVVLTWQPKLSHYLTADCFDLRKISDDRGPGYLMCHVRYADNKNMKNAKYLSPFLDDEGSRRFALKNLEKGKTYYIQYRCLPMLYFGVPHETCWGQIVKIRVK